MVSKYEKADLKPSTLYKKAVEKGLRVAFLDIETSPYLVWTYPLRKAFIQTNQIEETLKVTSIVLLEEGREKPEVWSWDFDHSTMRGCDKKCLKKVVKRLEEIDVVVMQNGDAYDAKVLQERIMQNKLPAITNLITIDTLKLSRRSFRKASHSLDARSKDYNFGGKDKQTMQDCIDVAKGKGKKQESRIKYNIKDVIDTRKVFLREMDYYDFDLKTLNLFKSYLKETRIYCVKCAARRQKKFDIKIINIPKKNKRTGKVSKCKHYECINCLHIWKVK